MTLQEKVKNKITALVPEILDLKFGCEVEWEGEKARVVGLYTDALKPRTDFVIIKPQIKGMDYIVEEQIKILGRPIQLADVLMAIEKRPGPDMFFVEGNWPNGIKITDSVRFAYGAIPGILKLWDFSLPLSGQSTETLKFLDSIL